METELLRKFAIALGLGLLVGLQRQRQHSQLAGIRTFPLITLFGALTALLAEQLGGWIVAAGLLSLALLILAGNFLKSKNATIDPGQTTELAMLLMFGVGCLLMQGPETLAVVLGGIVAILLHLKTTLHKLTARLGENDMQAIMQFAVISLVILPVLPKQNFGPYDVLNLYETWLMVVLIVGLGLLGYFAYKIFGEKAGTIAGGMLGGLISSTATTVTYAQRARSTGQGIMLAALVIVVASAVSVVRVISEIVVVAPAVLPQVLPPLLVFIAFMAGLAGLSYFFRHSKETRMPEQENPANLKTALAFGLLYAGVTLASAFAQDKAGASGMYVVAIISGLTDVDAITLATSRAMQTGNLPAETGWRIILAAVLANLGFKAALTGVLGNRQLFGRVALLFGLLIICGLLLLWFWPEISLPVLAEIQLALPV